MNHWSDIGDAYLCPICGYETRNPYRLPDVRCPVCEFKEKGQFDAWLTARRITTLCAWDKEAACLIFGTSEPEEIMRRNSVQGAQAKLNEYDEAQKEEELGIQGYFKKGEEVIDADGTKAVILRVSEENYCQVYTENGCIENWHIHTYKFHKTGKTHPEVESMLANMRRENEG